MLFLLNGVKNNPLYQYPYLCLMEEGNYGVKE
ncbi:hypothetical protein SAMN05444412_101316 [Rhodonellum ikkaensis]|uniref:Uncharacterized protein n=1 Tax=Rhodonellum ikkaensis TaxID=336829 RepID=A0A1H3KBS2_9BACT|nr:hypothetical protein SAMN05444412_101316 [Rhodonellum ikkaensis]